jgi:hypothetical protein
MDTAFYALIRVGQPECELREKEMDVYIAAKLGKKLLESYQELQSPSFSS